MSGPEYSLTMPDDGTRFWKPPSLEVPDDDPFAYDRLERKTSAENLTTVLSNSPTPLVLAVDAAWGGGKTTFLRMWRTHLVGQGRLVLFFNAWENDFVADPLLAIVSELDSALTDLAEDAGEDDLRARVKRTSEAGLRLVRRSIPVLIRAGTGLAIDEEPLGVVASAVQEVSEEVAEEAERRLSAYRSERAQIDAFRSRLEELARAVAEDDRGPIVFFVDELDRCRPDFAIRLLERVKHLFSVEGVVFVLAIDQEQLSHSIQAVYGSGFDARGYLKRFIDLTFNLPLPEGSSFVEHLYRASGLEEMERRGEGFDRRWIVEVLSSAANATRTSLRDLERCVSRLNLVYRTTPPQANTVGPATPLLVLLSETQPALYTGYLEGRVGAKDLLDHFARGSGEGDAIFEPLAALVRGVVYGLTKNAEERSRRIKTLQEQLEAARAAHQPDTAGSLRRELRIVRQLEGQAPRLLDLLAERIEFARRFS